MLIWLGKGSLRGIPAHNLTDEQAKQYGEKRLLKSGLYEKVKEKKTAIAAVQEDGEQCQE